MNRPSVWLIIIALVVGAFIGYVVERQRAIYNMENAKLSFQKQLDEVKAANEKLTIKNRQLQLSLTPTPTTGVKKITPTPSVKPEK